MENNDEMAQVTEVAEESTEVVTAEEPTETAETSMTEAEGDNPADGMTAEVVERMVAEAEERGYLRGRNERVDELMRRPPAQREASTPTEQEDGDEDAVMILREMRRSVWD